MSVAKEKRGKKVDEVDPFVWTTYSFVSTVLNPVSFQAKLQCDW